MENISARIKELIDDQGLSNSDFAKKTNLNPAIISHILSGRNKPSLQVVNQIKECFTNVNLDYLITGQGSLYTNFTNVKDEEAPAENPYGNGGAFPMEGVRVVSEPGTQPQRAEETKTDEPIREDQSIEGPPPPPSISKKETPATTTENADRKEIEQIVIFYSDGSFKAYRP